ncbi:MAG TPA: methylated-DNA--[protein]-cysteine S-methyltransferase [Candidatus Acidoferrales bacterium]|nr:methylated-DNA--[protein]-cysteine S-methyltransferase [Candidatus Acidoferrales bacterium]
MNSNRFARRMNGLDAVGDAQLDAMVNETRPRIERAMKLLRRPQARVGLVTSPVGRLLVAESDRGLVNIHFMTMDGAERTLEKLRRKFELVENEASVKRVGAEINRFFEGDQSVMERRVDLSMVESEFQVRALTTLRSVPSGAVITYQALAAAVGNPDSQRAIGNTMASNPVPIVVPCHRVIRSDGTIGNYGGGVENKLKLLRLEGFKVGSDMRLPSRAVMGHRRTHIFCRPDCSAAKRADSNQVLIFADAACAGHAGLRPCKLCRPA